MPVPPAPFRDPSADCAATATRSFELLDGTLAGRAAAAFAAHLAACLGCRARVADDRRFLALLRGRRVAPAVPPAMRARIRARLAAGGAPPAPPAGARE